MKKVLIYENRKTDAYVWDVTTPELMNNAYISLFRLLDEQLECYDSIREDGNSNQIQWYKEAKKGDYTNLYRLLEARRGYEYENWYVTNVENINEEYIP